MKNFIQEIVPAIAKNKLRTALTGFSVAWGIFMLIMLVSFGNGLKNGVMENFSGRAKNSISITPGITSIGFGGFSPGRHIKLDNSDYEYISNEFSRVICATPRIVEPSTISYDDEFGSWDIEGANKYITQVKNIFVPNGQGRFINEFDVGEKRKVIVINQDMKKILFKEEDPLGKYVQASGIMFEVIGVYQRNTRFTDKHEAFIPVSTAMMLYCERDEYHGIDFLVSGLDTRKLNEDYNQYIREEIGRRHRFDPNDRSALQIMNVYDAAVQANQIVSLIEFFIVIVGAASLLAGIMGISNIMIITVKERTFEIGILKALGATPFTVIRQIVVEALFITAVAGYVGLLIGVGLTEWISTKLVVPAGGIVVFKDPSVNLSTIIFATTVIVVCGAIAGIIPAWRAARIRPVEAIREES